MGRIWIPPMLELQHLVEPIGSSRGLISRSHSASRLQTNGQSLIGAALDSYSVLPDEATPNNH